MRLKAELPLSLSLLCVYMCTGGTGHSFPPFLFEVYYVVMDVIVGFALRLSLRRWLRALKESFCSWWIIFIEAQKSAGGLHTHAQLVQRRKRLHYQGSSTRRRRLVSVGGNDVTSANRQTLVLVKRRRPDYLSFLRCPMPRGGECEAERNVGLIMTYFHYFTLNFDWNMQDVPFLGQLCAVENPWQCNMLRWIDSRLLSAASFRYIQNVLVVTRVRPEEESLANSDDLLSDEEFVLDNFSFSNAICARASQKKQYEKNASAC